jgi:hypothetical protein
MDSDKFKTVSETHNKEWLANCLWFAVGNHGGIDMFNDNIGIELKGRYQKWSHRWAVHAYQIAKFAEQNPKKELFWAFMLYDLAKPVAQLTEAELPSALCNRKVWFMPWSWIDNFPQTNGTKTGEYVYVPKSALPSYQNIIRYRKNGGTLYVPPGSVLEDHLRR